MVLGGQKGELSRSTLRANDRKNCPLQAPKEESSVTDTKKKRCILHRIQEINYPRNFANEKLSPPELSLFADRFS